MSSVSTPAASRDTRGRPWIAWPLCVVGNLLIGYAARLPFSALVASAGWTSGLTERPIDQDEEGILFAVSAVLTVLVLAVFGGFNVLVRRRSGLPRRPYWSLAVALLLTPFVLYLFVPGLPAPGL